MCERGVNDPVVLIRYISVKLKLFCEIIQNTRRKFGIDFQIGGGRVPGN